MVSSDHWTVGLSVWTGLSRPNGPVCVCVCGVLGLYWACTGVVQGSQYQDAVGALMVCHSVHLYHRLSICLSVWVWGAPVMVAVWACM